MMDPTTCIIGVQPVSVIKNNRGHIRNAVWVILQNWRRQTCKSNSQTLLSGANENSNQKLSKHLRTIAATLFCCTAEKNKTPKCAVLEVWPFWFFTHVLYPEGLGHFERVMKTYFPEHTVEINILSTAHYY